MATRDIDELERQDRERHKQLLKEALTEWMVENPAKSGEVIGKAIRTWMDEQYATIGKWTVRGIGAMLIGLFFLWWFSRGGKI